MSSSDTIINKQLIIKKFTDNKRCLDLQNEIYEYLFLDKIQVKSRKNKRILIECMNRYLDRIEEEGECMWGIRYCFEQQLQATQCLKCGGYIFIGSTLFYNVARRALCCCSGYHEFYERQIALFQYYERNIANQSLHIFM